MREQGGGGACVWVFGRRGLVMEGGHESGGREEGGIGEGALREEIGEE